MDWWNAFLVEPCRGMPKTIMEIVDIFNTFTAHMMSRNSIRAGTPISTMSSLAPREVLRFNRWKLQHVTQTPGKQYVNVRARGGEGR